MGGNTLLVIIEIVQVLAMNLKFAYAEFDEFKLMYTVKENFQQWTPTLFFQEANIFMT